MNESDELAVEIEDVKRRYGHIEALGGVSLAVKKGSIFGLLGANGAGKTTLIKILVGTTRPDQAQVQVLGLNPSKDALRLRSLIGYMPQAAALYDDLSARDNIKFFGAAHHLSDLNSRVEESLEFTGL